MDYWIGQKLTLRGSGSETGSRGDYTEAKYVLPDVYLDAIIVTANGFGHYLPNSFFLLLILFRRPPLAYPMIKPRHDIHDNALWRISRVSPACSPPVFFSFLPLPDLYILQILACWRVSSDFPLEFLVVVSNTYLF